VEEQEECLVCKQRHHVASELEQRHVGEPEQQSVFEETIILGFWNDTGSSWTHLCTYIFVCVYSMYIYGVYIHRPLRATRLRSGLLQSCMFACFNHFNLAVLHVYVHSITSVCKVADNHAQVHSKSLWAHYGPQKHCAGVLNVTLSSVGRPKTLHRCTQRPFGPTRAIKNTAQVHSKSLWAHKGSQKHCAGAHDVTLASSKTPRKL